jgi:hypothetical protein
MLHSRALRIALVVILALSIAAVAGGKGKFVDCKGKKCKGNNTQYV